MYVVESGGHKVAPAPTKVKRVEYKTATDGGGGVERGGGGTHIAATVKNTVRRLLRRTKSHRDPPSTYAPMMTTTTTTSSGTNTTPTITNQRVSANYEGVQARRSQPPPPPSQHQTLRERRDTRRYSRPRARLQVRKLVWVRDWCSRIWGN